MQRLRVGTLSTAQITPPALIGSARAAGLPLRPTGRT
jgi:hypothetical protein